MAMQPDYRPSMGAAGWGRPAASAADYDAGLRAYMLRIFNWMASGLLLTGIVAFAVANVPAVQELFYTAMRAPGGRVVMQPTLLFWVATFSPLAFMLVLSFGYQRMSKTTVQALFWLFCVCMGASLSNLAFRYTGASIGRAFFCSAAMFAGMALYGYTTKADLTRMGSFMMMGLIGILIAGLVNIFMQSSALQFAISAIGVVVFAGLTAWDVQRIKGDYDSYASQMGLEEAGKQSVYDALGLYLNFINMFQSLLSLFGIRTGDE